MRVIIDPAWSVNDVLRRYPAAASVFNDFGLDTCCGGALSLAEAARHKRIDPERLYAALRRLPPRQGP